MSRVRYEHYFRALLAYLVGLSAVQVLTIGLSLAQTDISRAISVGVLLVALLSATAVIFATRKVVPPPEAPEQQTSEWYGPHMLVVVLAGLTYALLIVAACVGSDRSWDGSAYHIPTISFWARQGHIHWISEPLQATPWMNGYPKGAELLAFVLVKAFGSDSVVNTANLMFLPLGSIGIACIARLLGCRGLTALSAGMAWTMIPVNVGQAATTYVDSSFASCVVALFAAVIVAASSVTQSVARWGGTMIAVAASGGLAIAVKSSGVAVVSVCIAALAAVCVMYADRPSLRARSLALLACAVVGMLAVGGFWYLRNLALTGSPLYPVGLTLAGHTVWPGESIADTINTATNTPAELRGMPRAMQVLVTWAQFPQQWPDTIRGYDSRLGGLGYLWPIGCIPAILVTLSRVSKPTGDRVRRRLIWVLTAVAVASFLCVPMSWWARYTVWVFGLGLPCFALVVDSLSGLAKHRLVMAWVLLAGGVLLLEGQLSLVRALGRQYEGRVIEDPAGVFRHERWAPTLPAFPELRGTVMESIATNGSPVALGPLARGNKHLMLLGELMLATGSRDVMALPATPGREHLAELEARGIQHVIWDEAITLPQSLRDWSGRQETRVPGFVVLSTGHR